MTIHDDLSAFLGVKVKPVVTSFASGTTPPRNGSLHTNNAATKQQVISEFSNKLEERFEYKGKNLPEPRGRIPSKKWRGKTHERKLKERYLSPSYLFDLLNQKHLHQYDSGGRPICHGNCSFNCQSKFRYDPGLISEELQKWWGEESNNVKRDVFLYNDLKDWSIKNEDGTFQLRWFISSRQVCRNFYLRARGMHHSHVLKLQKQILHENRTSLSINLDRYERKDEKASPKKDEIVAWLSVFKKYVGGEQMPDEDFTVLPYRTLSPIYEEYKQDLECVGCPLGETPAKRSYFYSTFNEESLSLKIRLQRDTGTHKKCTVCDIYTTQLRSAKTWEERLKIKQWRKTHLQKQRAQREKYYKHRKKASDCTVWKTPVSVYNYGWYGPEED